MAGFDNFKVGSQSFYQGGSGLQQNRELDKAHSKVAQEANTVPSKKSVAPVMNGMMALAGGVVAGIAIARRGMVARCCKELANGKVPSVISGSNVLYGLEKEQAKNQNFDVLQRDRDIFNNERLKDIIRDRFVKITDIAKDSIERQKERLSELVRPSDKSPEFVDRDLFTSHEAAMVSSFQDEYAFNIPLRLGKIKPEKSIEIRTMDEIIQEATPLAKPAVVYRGIVTQQNGETLDFAKNLKVGAVLEDKAFVATSRNATVPVAEYGEQSGYIIRINLPEGTQGIDCRRFTMRDLSTGANADFILPRGTKLLINSIDDRVKIIDANYILPN